MAVWSWLEGKGRAEVDGYLGTGLRNMYSCQENPMDRGAWWAAVHGVTKNRTEHARTTTPPSDMRAS